MKLKNNSTTCLPSFGTIPPSSYVISANVLLIILISYLSHGNYIGYVGYTHKLARTIAYMR